MLLAFGLVVLYYIGIGSGSGHAKRVADELRCIK